MEFLLFFAVFIFAAVGILFIDPIKVFTFVIRPLTESYVFIVAILLVLITGELIGFLTQDTLIIDLIQFITRYNYSWNLEDIYSAVIFTGIAVYVLYLFVRTLYNMISLAFHRETLSQKQYVHIIHVMLFVNIAALLYSTMTYFRLTEGLAIALVPIFYVGVMRGLLEILDNMSAVKKKKLVEELFDTYQIPLPYTLILLIVVIGSYATARTQYPFLQSITTVYSGYFILDAFLSIIFKREHSSTII